MSCNKVDYHKSLSDATQVGYPFLLLTSGNYRYLDHTTKKFLPQSSIRFESIMCTVIMSTMLPEPHSWDAHSHFMCNVDDYSVR